METSNVHPDFEGNKNFEDMKLSPTVASIQDTLQQQEVVDAATFVEAILTRHPEYLNKEANRFIPLTPTTEKRPVTEWLVEIQSLFDPHRIQKLLQPNSPPLLHGRLVIAALYLLEQNIHEQLEKHNFFNLLLAELKEPFKEIITDTGLFFLNKLKDKTPTSNVEDSVPNSVPNQPDNPLQKIDEDQLARAAFAVFLAEKIKAVPDKSGAYSMHVYGPWGSGKSTLLNFIREELNKTDEWVVTEFNAWRNQHIRPPWWSLMGSVMESVFRQNNDKASLLIKLKEKLKEYRWRLNADPAVYFWGLIILLIWFLLFLTPSSNLLPPIAANAKNLGSILNLGLTLWVLWVGKSRSLTSSKAAESYMQWKNDPMETIKNRFNKLTGYVTPEKRNIIFIDDLDRCQGAYVIELLEGIQTLLKEAHVVFIIAADRDWLHACYDKAYKDFRPLVSEPGKPLGVLFLEKVFQFSTPVPGIPKTQKETYWRELINIQGEDSEEEEKQVEENVKSFMENVDFEHSSTESIIAASKDRSLAEQRAIREKAVAQLANPTQLKRTEHALLPFADLLDPPNPRSMKRLVNSYSVNHAIAFLSHKDDLDQDQLILWTILSMRWPILAKKLENDPKLIEKIGSSDDSDFPDEQEKGLKELFTDEKVIKVVEGGHTKKKLNADTVEQISELWSL